MILWWQAMDWYVCIVLCRSPFIRNFAYIYTHTYTHIHTLTHPPTQTYQRAALQEYIDYTLAKGQPLISPITRDPITEALYINVFMRKMVLEYKEAHTKNKQQAENEGEGGVEEAKAGGEK
jgi:hypothetical protein